MEKKIENTNARAFLKHEAKLAPNAMIDTDEKEVLALIEAGLKLDNALDVALVYPVTDIRRIVDTDDYDALKQIRGIGNKRAKLIVRALKGRIPAAMSKEQVRIPDPEMHAVPNLNLYVDENGNADLVKQKVRHGKLIFDEKGEPVKDSTLKRFGPFLQKAVELNGGNDENIVFTTISQVQEDWEHEDNEFTAKDEWHDRVYGGIVVHGEEYGPGSIGTNANMKCQIHWYPKRLILALRTWAMCGAKVRSNTNIAKLEAYIGLLMPYTKDLLGGVLNPNMEVLIDEWENVHKGLNMLISPEGKMEMKDTFTVNEFDGMAVLELTEELIEKMGLTKKEVKKLKKLCATFKGGTLRAPFQKGVLVSGFPIHEVLRRMGVTHIKGKAIEHIAIFGDMSVFKAKIGDDGLYKKFEDYCASFKELKHRFGVLLENHGAKRSYLPAQQLQAAHGCDTKFIEEGGFAEVEYLKAAQDPKVAAARYLPNAIAEIAQEDPRIAGVWFARDMVKTGYSKERYQSLSGATHDNSITGLVVKDLIAFCEWIAYTVGVRKELPVGCLKARQVLIPFGEYTGKGVASRNPVISKYGVAVVDVIETVDEEWAWAFENVDFIMVSIHDDLCKLLRMDHDGDKIRVTIAEWFVKAVESIEAMPFAEWETFGEAVKNMCTWDDTLDFFATRTVTPQLGRNVNFAGQLIALGLIYNVVSNEEAEWLMDYMMNKGTDVKQGADGSTCSGDAGEIWKKLKEALREAFDNGAKQNTIPQAYGKFIKTGMFPDKEDVETKPGKDNLSIVSGIVKAHAPKSITLPVGFPTTDLCVSRRRCVKGVKELFRDLVSQNRDAWEQMGEHEKETGGYNDFMAFKKQVALDRFEKFVEDYNNETVEKGLKREKITMGEVYDTLVTYVFDTLAKTYVAMDTTEQHKKFLVVLAITFCAWFGDKMKETYCANRALGCLKSVPQPTVMDDLFD